MQQSVHCESLITTQGATQQSVGVKKKRKKVGGKIAFSEIPNKWAQIKSAPQQRGTKSEVAASPVPPPGPQKGRKCYVTPAFSGIPKQRGTKSEVATSPLPLFHEKKKGGGGFLCPQNIKFGPSEKTGGFAETSMTS